MRFSSSDKIVSWFQSSNALTIQMFSLENGSPKKSASLKHEYRSDIYAISMGLYETMPTVQQHWWLFFRNFKEGPLSFTLLSKDHCDSHFDPSDNGP